MTLNYIGHFLTLLFESNGCISIFGFASLGYILTGILSFTIGLNICAIIAGIKKYKLIIKKRKKKHDEITLPAKTYKRLNF